MNPTKKNRVSFDDMPNMMAELLDEMRAISSRVKDLEDSYSIRKSDINSREILTAMEVANMLKLSRITVYRMASRGDIPCYKSGKNLMFYRDEILEWINSRSKTMVI